LSLATPEGEVRLGSRAWCGAPDDEMNAGPELWFARPGRTPVRFAFRDSLREDAGDTVRALEAAGYGVELLSGDRLPTVKAVAAELGIARWRAGAAPAEKSARLTALAAAGHRPLMVGDGLNDAPALASAWVSMSPASAADISQNAADLVFQGRRLWPVAGALALARHAHRLTVQNLVLALAYNMLAVPLAMAGLVTPLVAAIAMSSSSLIVIANALRLGR
jgi:Cu2+-exporting ATPase